MPSVLTKVVKVSSDKITKFPGNPRRGNVQAIMESLAENDQYEPIIVQRSSGHIVSGNHRYEAMCRLGWKSMDVIYVDVDDEKAVRILLSSNRTADLGTYDQQMLGEILSNTDSLPGTGYDQETVDLILDAISNDQLVDFNELSKPPTMEGEDVPFENKQFGEEDNSVGGSDEDDPDATDGPTRLEDADEDLAGAFQLKEDAIFTGAGYWQVPELRPDMLMRLEDLPDNLEAWAGSATKDWPDEEQWWLYNYGIDSTSGMKDVSKVIVSFWCWDEYFENWWHYPDRYVSKLLNSRIKYAVTPDYSMSSDYPRATNLWALYRSRWLGRYMQEAGIRIIPNIGWRNDDPEYLKNHVLSGVPKNAPIIGMQCHTGVFEPKGDVTQKMIDDYADMIRVICETLTPDTLLLYGGKPGRKLVEDLNLPWNIRFLENRITKLAEQQKGRTKKKTL